MNSESADPSELQTLSLDLAVAGKRLKLEVSAPLAPVQPAELLPLFRSLADTFVSLAVEAAESQGAKVSCQKGCGACCRQLVPVSEVEARQLAEMVAGMAEPRRSEILSRFQAARRRLEDAGLLSRLLEPERIAEEDLVPLGMDYFFKAIPCPFLEEESCSIHPVRPLACREFLVTTPAENCSRPSTETVKCVKVPLSASLALSRMNGGRTLAWAPLVLALEWTAAHPEGSEARPGVELVAEFFSHLTGQNVSGPESTG